MASCHPALWREKTVVDLRSGMHQSVVTGESKKKCQPTAILLLGLLPPLIQDFSVFASLQELVWFTASTGMSSPCWYCPSSTLHHLPQPREKTSSISKRFLLKLVAFREVEENIVWKVMYQES